MQASNAIREEREFKFTDQDFQAIAEKVRRIAGLNLPESKRSLVYSRLAKRIRKLNLGSFAEYVQLLESDIAGDEQSFLITSLTTNVTAFFRENHHFEHLSGHVLPELAKRAKAGERIRFWSSACSSGEEPFSIALCLAGALPEFAGLDVKILATDIDENTIARAKRAAYPIDVMKNIPTSAQKHLVIDKENETVQLSNEVRSLVTFGQLNLFDEWPFRGQFDVIFCRNVAIYFDKETQARLWKKLADRLVSGGQIYIGHSERISGPAASILETNGVTQYRKR